MTMENDDDARKSLLAGNRRSQTDDSSTRSYYDMQQPSSTTVSDVYTEGNGCVQARLARLYCLRAGYWPGASIPPGPRVMTTNFSPCQGPHIGGSSLKFHKVCCHKYITKFALATS